MYSTYVIISVEIINPEINRTSHYTTSYRHSLTMINLSFQNYSYYTECSKLYIIYYSQLVRLKALTDYKLQPFRNRLVDIIIQ